MLILAAEPEVEPIEKDFWREGLSWRTVSGLIKRITFPNEDPGGWLLPEAMHQASNPVKTRPSRLTSSGNWVLPPKHSFSSSAQTIKVAFSDFTSLFLHTSVSYFTHSFFESLTCIQPALSLTSSPPQLYFPLKLTPHFLWTDSKSISYVRLCFFCWDTAFPHSSDKTKPYISLRSEMWQLWDRGVRSLTMNIWRMLM